MIYKDSLIDKGICRLMTEIISSVSEGKLTRTQGDQNILLQHSLGMRAQAVVATTRLRQVRYKKKNQHESKDEQIYANQTPTDSKYSHFKHLCHTISKLVNIHTYI